MSIKSKRKKETFVINALVSVHTSLTMLDVLPEDPELGVVLKCNKAALSGGAHLPQNRVTADQN